MDMQYLLITSRICFNFSHMEINNNLVLGVEQYLKNARIILCMKLINTFTADYRDI